MAKQDGQKETRTKTWTLVLYPESAPENWRDIIDENHIRWIESPLHDKDLTATGEVKKAHWHILLLFETLKAFEQVKEITGSLNGPIPERCHDAKALTRYMAHLDDPNKAQYSKDAIIPHGGADLRDLLSPSSSERYAIIGEMVAFVKDNHVTEYQDVMDYAREHENERWFPLLCDSASYVVNLYCRSQRHRQNSPIKVDAETGEII